MENYLYYIWIIAAGGLSYGVTRLVMWVNIKDIPNDRSSHVKPTPKAGGCAVFVPFWCCLVWHQITFGGSVELWAVLGASTGMAIMGLWDDIKGLSWKTRLGIQCLMASLVVYTGIYVDGIWLPYFGYVSFGSAAPALTMLGIVVFTNVYNFMDGLNGLSIGCTLIGLGFLGTILFIHPEFSGDLSIIPFMIVSLWVSLLVLFFFNFPRARIFLGDTGSQFLGFMVIVMGILISMKVPNNGFDSSPGGRYIVDSFTFSPLMVPFLFFTFSFDGIVTIIRRLFLRVPIWEADRGHVFHRLLDRTSPLYVAFAHFGLFIGSGIIVCSFLACPPRFFILGAIPLLILHGIYLGFVLIKNKETAHA